ncbi:MAG: hypothetical protein IT406_03520 [Candidatus Yanofskybacteria bacterium]|nr:hypothetical protein [Candidatus Yanofskybacteria bacterium]
MARYFVFWQKIASRLWQQLVRRRAFFGMTVLGLVLAASIFLIEPKIVGLVTRNEFLQYRERVRQHAREQTVPLLDGAREIARSDALIHFIRDGDVSSIALLAHREGEKRGINAVLVVDRNGVALSRSYAVTQYGDYTFQASPWGDALSRGEEVSGIDRGVAHPLVMFAGVPVMDNGEFVGAVVTAFPLYDDYASVFRSTHLRGGEHVAFYRRGIGLTGASFTDQADRSAIAAYLNSGSDLTTCCSDPELLRIHDDVYLIGNIVFPGVREPAGGMILLHPVQSRGQRLGMVLGMTVALLAALSYLAWRRRLTLLDVRWALFFCALFFFFALQIILTVFLTRQGFVRVMDVPETTSIYNSTMSFGPETAVFELNSEHRIAINVETGGERVNAIRAVASFDPSRVAAVGVESTDSLCEKGIVLERTIDNESGTVSVSCGLLGAEFSGTDVFVRLILRPLKAGDFTLRFAEGTQVLANDGLGTSVLRSWTDSGYTVIAERSSASSGKIPFTMFSPTHPNRERWYSSRDVGVSWLSRPGIRYTYAVDATGSEVPVPVGDSSLEVVGLSDGAHMIRLSAWKDGIRTETAEIRLKIDGTPPEGFMVRASDTSVVAGDVVRIDAAAADNLSGLQKSTYVQVDDGVLLPVRLPVSIPFTRKGVHQVMVRVFDNAGNHADATTEIHVRSRSGFIDRFLNELLPTISGFASSFL